MIAKNVCGRVGLVLWACGVAGCQQPRPESMLADAGLEMTLAVAPALNHSGASDFDPIRAAEIMTSELGQFDGVKTISMARVLAQLDEHGMTRVESPSEALEIAERLGADGIIVFAVTEFDPYDPPVIGIAAQIYGHGSDAPWFDPVDTSRQASPPQIVTGSPMPRVEFQRTIDARNDQVVKGIKAFAKRRNADDSPFGWRKYLATQEDYLRFCSFTVLCELIRQEVTHVAPAHERRK